MSNVFYKNHIVSGQQYKPLLHKKGKQWIVVGLSSLLLTGLGVVTNTATHADTTNNNASANQKTAVQAKVNTNNPAVNPAKVSTKNIQPSNNGTEYQQKNVSELGRQKQGNNSNISQQAGNLHNALLHQQSNQPQAKQPASQAPVSNGVQKASMSSVAPSSASVKSAVSSATPKVAPKAVASIANKNDNEIKAISNNTKSLMQVGNSYQLGSAQQVTETVKFHDIYSDIDGLSKDVPSDTPCSGSQGEFEDINTPKGWAFVNNNGQYIGNSDDFLLQNGTKTFNVVPVYYGLAYKYNKNAKTIEFIGGTMQSTHPYLEGNTVMNDWTDSSDNPYHLFDGIKSIKFDNDINTSQMSDNGMYGMFMNLHNLKFLDLGDKFDTSNVTNMNSMFSGDLSLQSLNLGDNFDTSNVTNMSTMFANDRALQPLDLGDKFDTSNVTNMYAMFFSDTSLKSLNLGSKFDTSNVTNMSTMFANDRALQSLDLGDKFNTSNVTNMSSMFGSDYDLQSLDLGDKFNTSNVTDMSNMFVNDRALQSLDLGDKFNTSNVTNMNSMFGSDYDLQPLDLGDKFDTSNVTDMSNMFALDSSLKSLNLGNKFDTSNVTDMSNMFAFDSGLQSLTIPSSNTKFNSNITLWSDKPTYQITSPSNIFSFIKPYNKQNLENMQSHVGIWTPNTPNSKATDTINYETSDGNVVASKQFTGNFNQVLNASFNVPLNYMATSNTQFNYDGNTHVVNIRPMINSDMVDYTDSDGNYVSSVVIKGQNGTSAKSAIDSHVPNGHTILDNTDNQNFNDSGSIDVTVSGSNNTSNNTPINMNSDMVDYTDSDGNYVSSVVIKGQNGTSAKSAIDSHVPNGHTILDNTDNQNFNDSGSIDVTVSGSNNTSNVSDTVDYFNASGNYISSVVIKGVNGTSAKSAIDSHVPNGHTVLDNTDNQKFNDMGSIDVTVSGSNLSNASDTVYYLNTSGHYINSAIIKGVNGTSAKSAIDSHVPNGHTILDNTDNQKFNDKGSIYVTVSGSNNTSNVSDTVDYFNASGNYISSVVIKGQNGTSAKSAIDSHVPNGHTVLDNTDNQKFNDMGSIDVTVSGSNNTSNNTPINMNSDMVDYTDSDGNYVSSVTIKGIVGKSAKTAIDGNIPNGYNVMSDTDNQDFNDAGYMSVTVSNKFTDIINYQYNGQTKSSKKFMGAHNAKLDINSKNDTNIPNNYHLVFPDNNFTYDGNTHNVPITLNKITDTIVYVNSHNHNEVIASDFTPSDTIGSRTNINWYDYNYNKMPANWNIDVNVNSNPQFTYDGNRHVVYIAPNHTSDTIQYKYNGKILNTHRFGGNNSGAQGASDTSFTIGNNPKGLPDGYYVINPNQTLSYNGNNQTINIAPRPISSTIKFHDIYSDVDGMKNPNNIAEKGIPFNSYSISSPNGWALVNPNGTIANNPSFTYNSGNHTLDIAPIDDGLTYKFDKNTQTVEFISGNANSNLSDFSNNAQVKNAKVIIFGNNINTNNVTNIHNMLSSNNNLESIIFSNNFDTSHITDMDNALGNDPTLNLVTIQSPNTKFNSDVNIANSGKIFYYKYLNNLAPNQRKQIIDDISKATNDVQYNDYSTSISDFDTCTIGQLINSDKSFTSSMDIPADFTNSDINELNQYSSMPINKLLAKVPKYINKPWYRKDNNDKYTSSTPNDFSKGNTGTFTTTPNINTVTDNITFHDIYGNIDGMTSPLNTTKTGNPSSDYTVTAPQGWVFVDNNGKIVSNPTYTYGSGNHTLNVAPYNDTDTINYVDGNGNQVGSTIITGNYNSNAKSAIDSNVTNNYKIINNTDDHVYKPGQTYNIDVQSTLQSDTISFHDIYGNIDDLIAPSDYSKTGHPNSDYTVTAPQGWAFVDDNGKVVNNPTYTYGSGNHTLDIAPVYKGLVYKYDKKNGALEFTDGKINVSNASNFLNVPQFGGGYNQSDSQYTNDTLKLVKFNSDVDTSKVTNMNDMFYDDSDLQTLDLGSNFDTSNVTNMSGMFDIDTKLQSLNLGDKFNTSNVTDMSNMFDEDSALRSLDLGNHFDTSNVTNMSGMFDIDSDLQTLDLGSNFDTSNVTNMDDMFYADDALQSLDLGNHFDTSNVTDMSDMFDDDKVLQSLDLGNHFDTSNVTKMNGMFENEFVLQSLDLGSRFDTSKVTNMSDMFNNDMALQSLNLGSNFDTSNVTNMSEMFDSDNNLRQINIGNPSTKFNDSTGLDNVWRKYSNYTPGITKGTNLNNYNSVTLDNNQSHVGDWIINKPVNDTISFHDIYGNIDDFTNPSDISKNGLPANNYTVTAPSNWAFVDNNGDIISNPSFTYLSGNHTLNVAPVWNGLVYKYNKATDDVEVTNGIAGSSFGTIPSSISNVKSIKFDNNIDTSHVINMSNMFNGDSSLQSIDFGNKFDTSHVTNMGDMFAGDNHLDKLNVGSHNTVIPKESKEASLKHIGSTFWVPSIDAKNPVLSRDVSRVLFRPTWRRYVVPRLCNVIALTYNQYLSKIPSDSTHAQVNQAMIKVNTMGKILQQMQQGLTYRQFVHKLASKYHILPILYRRLLMTSHFTNTPIKDVANGSPRKFTNYKTVMVTTGTAPTYVPTMYKQDTNDNYTAPTSNDFNDGNIGTFVRPENVPVDTVNYQYNGKTIATQQFKGDVKHYNSNGYNNLTNNDFTKVPSGYHLANNNSVLFNGKTYNVAIVPNTISDNIIFNGDTDANTKMTGAYGKQGTVTAPKGYHFTDNTQSKSITFDGKDKSFNVAKNIINDKINFVNGNNQFVGTTTASGNQYSDYTIANIPTGYQLTKNQAHQIQLTNNGTINVNVAPVSTTITINYMDNGSIKHSASIKGTYGSKFHALMKVLTNMPKGYQMSRPRPIKGMVTKFTNNNQSLIVNIVPDQTNSTMHINYVNSQDGSKVDSDVISGVTGSNFSIKPYLENIPSGTSNAKVIGSVPSAYTDKQSITIKVTPLANTYIINKNVNPNTQYATLIVHYIDDGQDVGTQTLINLAPVNTTVKLASFFAQSDAGVQDILLAPNGYDIDSMNPITVPLVAPKAHITSTAPVIESFIGMNTGSVHTKPATKKQTKSAKIVKKATNKTTKLINRDKQLLAKAQVQSAPKATKQASSATTAPTSSATPFIMSSASASSVSAKTNDWDKTDRNFDNGNASLADKISDDAHANNSDVTQSDLAILKSWSTTISDNNATSDAKWNSESDDLGTVDVAYRDLANNDKLVQNANHAVDAYVSTNDTGKQFDQSTYTQRMMPKNFKLASDSNNTNLPTSYPKGNETEYVDVLPNSDDETKVNFMTKTNKSHLLGATKSSQVQTTLVGKDGTQIPKAIISKVMPKGYQLDNPAKNYYFNNDGVEVDIHKVNPQSNEVDLTVHYWNDGKEVGTQELNNIGKVGSDIKLGSFFNSDSDVKNLLIAPVGYDLDGMKPIELKLVPNDNNDKENDKKDAYIDLTHKPAKLIKPTKIIKK